MSTWMMLPSAQSEGIRSRAGGDGRSAANKVRQHQS